MCTLVVIRNTFKGYPFVVAANRDELFSRPAEPPSLRDGPHKILSPTDLQRGGSWIGVNEAGLFVALTNRKGIPSLRNLRSRGELVTDALRCASLEAALASVVNRDAREYNGCYLVIADAKGGYLLSGNGKGGGEDPASPEFSYAPLADGLTIVTNLGTGPGSPRGNAIVREWDELKRRGLPPPRHSAFTPMLTRHEREHPSEGAFGRRYGDVCLHPADDDPDYGSVSSSVIRLSDTFGGTPMSWQYWHGFRKKGSAAACHIRWSDMHALPIATAT